jgi:flavorubredoxin
MANALVVFTSAHGETRRAAEAIASGLARTGRVRPILASAEDVLPETVRGSDVVVLGAWSSGREAAREARHLVGLLPAGMLDRKIVSVFDAGPGARHGAGARTLRQTLLEVDPGLHLAAPGISVPVGRAHGELPDPAIALCRQFGEHLAGIAAASGAP